MTKSEQVRCTWSLPDTKTNVECYDLLARNKHVHPAPRCSRRNPGSQTQTLSNYTEATLAGQVPCQLVSLYPPVECTIKRCPLGQRWMPLPHPLPRPLAVGHKE